MSAKTESRRRKVFLAAVTLAIFLLFGGICFAAGALIWRQGQEVDVSVDTSGEHFTERVTLSVRNVLGMDILIDERAESCARLQFYEGGVWIDVCEIGFVNCDSTAISVKYGGMYAHLAPGATLSYELDEELLHFLPSGRYRVAIPYISEESYLAYLLERAEDIDESLEAESAAESADEDVSVPETEASEEESLPDEQSTPPRPEIEVFYKEFSITNRADGTQSEPSQGLDVSIDVG